MTYDYLIVGAGLFGATMARSLHDKGHAVAVIESRFEVGGNCSDHMIDGIRVSDHGGHIFHTNDAGVWDFVHRFADWFEYTHRVLAVAQGRRYSFPVNLETLYQLWGITDPQEAAEVLSDAGRVKHIRYMFFDGYTAKQWGRPIEQVPPHVIARIPMRSTWDGRYFTDAFQGLPIDGYSAMIKEMLRGIPVSLGCPYKLNSEYWRRKARQVIYTGPLDELYGYCFGELEYRSLRFEHEHRPGDFQGCATVNYCDAEIPYTRILEHKHFGWQKSDKTIITREFPASFERGINERYYPIGGSTNNTIHAQYTQLADKDGLIIGGRLGMYRYMDMDKTIRAALDLAQRIG
jgi:UDP-galactopyranose mutase